jgi:putative intracellular protease/amidase
MSLRDVHRGCLAGLVVALCLAPAVQAGTRDGVQRARVASARVQTEDVLQVFWRGLAHLFDKSGSAIVTGTTPGATSGPPATGSEGASIDPSGVPHG